jgi:hypothetical protein
MKCKVTEFSSNKEIFQGKMHKKDTILKKIETTRPSTSIFFRNFAPDKMSSLQ